MPSFFQGWLGPTSFNSDLEAEGTVEKVAGKVQIKIGRVKRVLRK